MRKNFPVTNNEYAIGDDTLIVSKTDIKGKLTYFNDQFVAASGFVEAELAGQPHNIVRHPDMPPEAFEDLWATLKAGRPWAGAVKNRRKNGDFYWVLASATPIWEDDKIAGYMSIRSRLADDQRREAEHVYGLIRDNKANRYKVEAGIIRRRSWSHWFSVFTRTLKARLWTLVASLAFALLTVGLTGIMAANNINSQMRSLYAERLVLVADLADINNRMQDNIFALYRGAFEGVSGAAADHIASAIKSNNEAINKELDHFMGVVKTADVKSQVTAYIEKRREFFEQGVKPGLAMLATGNFADLPQHFAGRVTPLFTAVKETGDKLIALQLTLANTDFEAAQRTYTTVFAIAVGVLIAGLLFGGMLALRTISAIASPIEQLNRVMANIAQGKFNSRITIERDDELGVALRNLQALQAKLGFDREEQKDTDKRIAAQRKADLAKLAIEFEAAIGEIVGTVSSAATELEASAATLTTAADSTQQLATTVAGAAEEASTNVQSVAASAEEMASTVDEIGRQVQESSRIANDAVAQAKTTDERIVKLSAAAGRIGDVTKMITEIASQTNLLALNATIEAARAGDAGRGFAVVASEVKSLADQTAKATSEISNQIAEIQSATQDSVSAIKDVGETIGKISEISAAIAAAVEEQGMATREISRNIQQAAQGTTQVSSSITEVNRSTTETGSASSQVLSAAQSLANESNRLKIELDQFLTTVRAA